MDAPSFSVVCAAYNTGYLIEATLRSLAAQTIEDFEVIVVDDGSTDDTASRVAGFCDRDDRFRLIRQENSKPAAARNRALTETRGEWISFIDSDDLWLPNYLETVRSAFADAPEVGICFCDLWMLDDITRKVHYETFRRLDEHLEGGRRVFPAEELELMLVEDNIIPTSATTITRSALDATGGFDSSPRLYGAEDWDLWLRIAHAGFGAVKVPEAVAVWRDRAGSETKKSLMLAQGSNAAVRSAWERNPDHPEVGRLARMRIAQTEHDIASQAGTTWPIRVRASAERRLRAVKRQALRNREWLDPPEELAEFLERTDRQTSGG